jgi:pimeloyl-ACP methyl ester carboxylesterase/DNA-binding CsgD family transcriptional regulator
MQDRDILARLAAAEVLSGLYEAIADHTQFDSMLNAMDDFLDANPDELEAGNADWKRVFRQHFTRAGQFLETNEDNRRETPIVFVDRQVVPTAVINRRLDILAGNTLIEGLLGQDIVSLKDRFTTPADERRFFDLVRANAPSPAVLISFTLPHVPTPVFVVASQAPMLELAQQTGPLITIKVAKATWNSSLIPLLETAYDLTPAEIEVLKGLVELGAVSSIAEQRGRSIRTVRTQLTHIFAKLGLTSQTELALFLATLTQLMTKQKQPSDIAEAWLTPSFKEIEQCAVEHNGHVLSYIKYGDPNGTPVLLIHTTTPPDLIPEFRDACQASGVFVIAAHKPGSGGSSARDPKDGPKALADHYAAILDAENLDRAIVGGHCSGGVYALQFAKAHPDRCKALILLDTGVPYKTRSELMAMPKGLRRTFLPARYIPEILLVPHRIFAYNFKRSAAGEARVVDYFFDGDPVDKNLTQTDRRYYEITRRIIEYSFEDVDRLVSDVCHWARDWSALLSIADTHPVAFVHGHENQLFRTDKIEQYVNEAPNAQLFASNGMGQLHIYQNPGIFIQAVHAQTAETT